MYQQPKEHAKVAVKYFGDLRSISFTMRWFALLVVLGQQLLIASARLSITARGPRINRTFLEGNIFNAPFSNLPLIGIQGPLYYQNDSCLPPDPPAFSSIYNVSILIVENFSNCILTKIALAKGAGYDMILTFTVNDSNFTINDAIIATSFPLAVVSSGVAEDLIANVTIQFTNDTSFVSVMGNVVEGVVLVAFMVVFAVSLACCCCIWVLICCKLYCEENEIERDIRLLEAQRDFPRRQELIESIMRHLQQLEDDIGAQTPLGADRTRRLPSHTYKAGSDSETCAICVDEFTDGERVKKLPCDHIFHPTCIDEWLINHSSLCPLCKVNLRFQSQPPRASNDTDDDDASRLTLSGSSHAYGTMR